VQRDRLAEGSRLGADIWVKLPDGRQINYDAIAWWQNYLLLLEAKCVKTAFDGADDFSTRSAVEKSIEQLIRRRDSLVDYWPTLRQLTSQLGLPDHPPSLDRVLCISVTNSMRFNGLTRDGVICTDDLCLLKYFGEAQTPVYEQSGEKIAIVGYAQSRRHERKDPRGLFEYLRDPPQVKSLAKDVKIKMRGITPLPGDTSVAVVPTYTFSGSIASTVSNLNDGSSV